MKMSPELAAERVSGMAESVRNSSSQAFSQHNANEALNYIAQVHEIGIINDAQRAVLESAVRDARRAQVAPVEWS